MLARFTFSVIILKYGEESWVLSQNDQCGNGKHLGVEDLLYIYLFINTYIYIKVSKLWKTKLLIILVSCPYCKSLYKIYRSCG